MCKKNNVALMRSKSETKIRLKRTCYVCNYTEFDGDA